MTGAASILPKTIAALTALLLAAGLFAWMNTTGDALNEGFEKLIGYGLMRTGGWPVDDIVDVFEGRDPYVWVHGDLIPGNVGPDSILFVLLAGALTAVVGVWRSRRVPYASRSMAQSQHCASPASTKFGRGLSPRTFGLVAAACLTGALLVTATLASRTMGEDFDSTLERVTDRAATTAGLHYEQHHRLPSHLTDLPYGYRYDVVDTATIKICGYHALGGERCTRRIAWDAELGAFEPVPTPFWLSRGTGYWEPQDTVWLLFNLGFLTLLIALGVSAYREVSR